MTHRRPASGLALILSTLVPSLLFLASCKSPSSEEVKKSMEIVGLESKWVSREYRTWPHPKLVLVPAITFRVKNLSSAPLTFVNFNALFRESDATKFNGDCYLAAIRNKGVPPGELSDPIFMKSNLGVDGTTLASIRDNKLWKPRRKDRTPSRSASGSCPGPLISRKTRHPRPRRTPRRTPRNRPSVGPQPPIGLGFRILM
jgi:hypothetical protein